MIADQRNKKTGGLTTISPPAKVKFPLFEELRVLANGIDTLYLSMDIEWENSLCFEMFESLKLEAVEGKKDVPVTLGRLKAMEPWMGCIKPYGAEGYEWIIVGHEFSFKVGNWKKPISRASAIVQFRSEVLWRMGPQNAVKRVCDILDGEGAKIVGIKPGRVDVCLDMLMPESAWSADIAHYKVGRAREIDYYTTDNNLNGIHIGRGPISARIYDKVKEITTKSKKYWMYDVWQLYGIPDNHRVIRVEFQLRRESIKKLGIDTIDELFKTMPNLWAYCTQKWLQFKTNPGKHHTQRKTLAWWELVQHGFSPLEVAEPLLRCDTSSENRKQAADQIYGNLTSWSALRFIKSGRQNRGQHSIKESLSEYHDTLMGMGKTDAQFSKDVNAKYARYYRSRDKIADIQRTRQTMGQPTNIVPPGRSLGR